MKTFSITRIGYRTTDIEAASLDEAFAKAPDIDWPNEQHSEYVCNEAASNSCKRCGSDLSSGRCSDETCPFSDCEQNDSRGWAGHPDMDRIPE